jgi:hypothetical protein
MGAGRDQLSRNDVLVVDEAGMIGTRQMERCCPMPATPAQGGAGGRPRAVAGDRSRRGVPVDRRAPWRGRDHRGSPAARGLAEGRDAGARTGRTGEALHAYESRGMVQAADTREGARGELVGWDRQRQAEPDKTRIILTHTNAEVRELNQEARGGCARPASWARTWASPSIAAGATSHPATGSCSCATSAAWA